MTWLLPQRESRQHTAGGPCASRFDLNARFLAHRLPLEAFIGLVGFISHLHAEHRAEGILFYTNDLLSSVLQSIHWRAVDHKEDGRPPYREHSRLASCSEQKPPGARADSAIAVDLNSAAALDLCLVLNSVFLCCLAFDICLFTITRHRFPPSLSPSRGHSK